jgi:hypothetical protein
MAGDIFSVIPHGVEMEVSLSIQQDVNSWRQSKTTVNTLCGAVVVMRCAGAKNVILVGSNLVLDATEPENNIELSGAVELRVLHRMVNVHDYLKFVRTAKTYVLCRRNLEFETSK